MLGPDVPVAEFVGHRNRLVKNHPRPRRVRQIRHAIPRARLTVLNHALDGRLYLVVLDAQVLENVHHQRVVFLEQAEEEMLGSHVLVMAAMRFLSRLDERAAYSICEVVPGQKGLLVEAQRFVLPGHIASILILLLPLSLPGRIKAA